VWLPRCGSKTALLVFVGYGIVAPEYGWDDYKGVDVNGKTIVMLVNDPPITVTGDTVLDESMFRGKAMTYYGRWTYKYEIAAAKGAAAAIIIHETGPAGYPFDVLAAASSWRASTSSPRTTTWIAWPCSPGCPSPPPGASSRRWDRISIGCTRPRNRRSSARFRSTRRWTSS
jgi:hypothetical protein